MVGSAFLEESVSHCSQARHGGIFRTCVKSGFKVPKNIDLSYKLDEQNGNSLRRDAINKEMHHAIPAFIVFNCISVDITAKIELEISA